MGPDYNWLQFFVGWYLIIIGIAGTTANITVLIMYLRFRKLGSPTALLLANLTVSDLGLILVHFPFAASSCFANRWLFGETSCRVYAFCGFFFGTAHIASLMLLGIDRYRDTCVNSLIYHAKTESSTYRSYYKMIAFSWLHGLAWALAPMLGWARFGLHEESNTCTIDWQHNDLSYKTFLCVYASVGFFLPCVVTFSCYYFASCQTKARGVVNRSNDPISDYWHNSKTITLMTVLINISFVVAWIPFAILCFWTVFDDPRNVPFWLALISPLSCKTSTLFNPIIYYCTNSKLRSAINCVLGIGSKSFEELSLTSIRPRTQSSSSVTRVTSF